MLPLSSPSQPSFSMNDEAQETHLIKMWMGVASAVLCMALPAAAILTYLCGVALLQHGAGPARHPHPTHPMLHCHACPPLHAGPTTHPPPMRRCHACSIFVGESGVGKTCLLTRLCTNEFKPTTATVGERSWG